MGRCHCRVCGADKKEMKKSDKLRLCGWGLALMGVACLASSVQLEVCEGKLHWAVWLHVVLCSVMMIGVGYHIYLHFQFRNWFACFRKLKSHATRVLAVLCALALTTGVVALVQWAVHQSHSGIGAVHGKIGFVFLLLCIGHAIKRKRFFVKNN